MIRALFGTVLATIAFVSEDVFSLSLVLQPINILNGSRWSYGVILLHTVGCLVSFCVCSGSSSRFLIVQSTFESHKTFIKVLVIY